MDACTPEISIGMLEMVSHCMAVCKNVKALPCSPCGAYDASNSANALTGCMLPAACMFAHLPIEITPVLITVWALRRARRQSVRSSCGAWWASTGSAASWRM